jgi:phosphonate transport system substrate-binding protein
VRVSTARSLAGALVLSALLPSAAPGQRSPETPLRLGVVTFYNPRLMFVKYQPLVEYLSSRTGQAWTLKVTSSYEETVEDLCAGHVTLAYLGPLTYVRAHARCGAEPLLRLRTHGQIVFHSDILVRSDSPFETLEDLSGRRVGFGDPLSTSSHLVPRAMLEDAGLQAGRDFECRYFGQHEEAAQAVLTGEVDACGVRDIIADIFLRRGLRRLARSGPIPAYPLALAPDTSPELRETLVSVLLGFPGSARPRREQERWDLELTAGFTTTADADYDPIRRIAARVFGPAFLGLPEGELRCR